MAHVGPGKPCRGQGQRPRRATRSEGEATFRGGPEVTVHWSGPETLIERSNTAARVLTAARALGETCINYRPIERELSGIGPPRRLPLAGIGEVE